MTIKPLLILLFALTFVFPVQAEIYKWTGANGKAHFSGLKPANQASEHHSNLEVKSPQVDLYMTKWCPYCKKAIVFLNKNNIAFNAYDIEQDPDAAARKKTLDPGYSGIPLAVINSTAIRGFSEDLYQEALTKK